MAGTSYSYPAIVLDSAYGTTIQIPLSRVNGVKQYNLVVNLGTLSGGTSPAWNVSGSNPLITHVKIQADNDTVFDLDSQAIFELNKLLWGIQPNGTTYLIPVADLEYRIRAQFIPATELPTYAYNQLILYLTIAPLSQVTTGSPTGSSGTVAYLTESYTPRAQMPSALYKVRKYQRVARLSVTGRNDLTNFFSQTGSYKSVLLFANTGNSYSTGSNSLITNINLVLNDQSYPVQTTFANLQAENTADFVSPPDTGYAMLVFSHATGGLDLSNINTIKAVDLQVYTTATGYLEGIFTEYLA
jgi:hypothetical protein